jgi:hypothetical protein
VPPAVVSIAESVGIGDVPGAVPPAVVSIAESVGIGDVPGAVPPAVVSIAEPIAIGDVPGAVPPAVVSIAEPVAVGDAPSAVPPNRTPTADAGPDQTVATGSTVPLDGSGSSDPDGTPLLFSWSLASRPQGSAAALSSSTIVNPTFGADRPGDYVARLTVGDGVVSSAPDTVAVTVRDGADLRIAFHPPSTTTTPPVSSRAEFFVIVTNAGPASTTGVTARVQLPAGYTSVTVGEIHGTYDPATGTWSIGALLAGQEAHLGLAATVNPTGPYDVPVTITGSSQPDPDPANDTATVTVTPTPAPSIARTSRRIP